MFLIQFTLFLIKFLELFLWTLHKSLRTVTTAMKLKEACSLEEKLDSDKPR